MGFTEVHRPNPNLRHVDVLLISDRLSNVSQKVGYSLLSGRFDVSSAHRPRCSALGP